MASVTVVLTKKLMARAISVLVFACLPTVSAIAQTVERNLPPEAPRRAPGLMLGTSDLLGVDDDTPLGVDVRGIVLIGAKDKVAAAKGVRGISVEAVDSSYRDALRQRLALFVGRPLTRKLIADSQAEVAAVYREVGRPFVSVTIPPQEASGGVLSLRVIEFRLQGTTVASTSAELQSYVLDRVRAKPGDPIIGQQLETDLDWLNRNPFWHVEAVFQPGRALGQTLLELRPTSNRPWQVFAGYANSGTLLTDRDRWFVGATASPFTRLLASYQLSGSRDFWMNDGEVLGDTSAAKYVSHAARAELQLWPRSSLEVTANYVETNEKPDAVFLTNTRTTEVAPLWRTAVSNYIPGGIGDWIAGAEFKWQERTTFFDSVVVANGAVEVFQVVGGWNARWNDGRGSNNIDIRVKHNPGDVLSGNTTANWNAYTNGRVDDIRSTFATIGFNRVTPLPSGFTLSTEFYALLSNRALPDTERLALGGVQTVRGYAIEDSTVDRAFIARNSLHLPSIGLSQSGLSGSLVPFAFADVGWGRDLSLPTDTRLSSVGAGLDLQLGSYFRANLTGAYALDDSRVTSAGGWRLHVRATAAY